jgi:hypothetical protein
LARRKTEPTARPAAKVERTNALGGVRRVVC